MDNKPLKEADGRFNHSHLDTIGSKEQEREIVLAQLLEAYSSDNIPAGVSRTASRARNEARVQDVTKKHQ